MNSGSFTYVIEASFGYRVGAPQTQTSYTWTRDMIPGRTYSFVMWAGDAKGRESARSNTVTVTLPVDTTPPAAPVVSVTGTTSSTVGLAWGPVSDDDSTCCTYRVSANGVLVTADNLQWTGEQAVTVLRLAAATTHSFTIVAVDPSRNAAQTGIDRWITYGTQTPNTFSVQAVDSAGNRSPATSVTLTNQTC